MVNFLYSGSISYAKKRDLYKFLSNLKEIFGFCNEIDFFEESINGKASLEKEHEVESDNEHIDLDASFENNLEDEESNDYISDDLQDEIIIKTETVNDQEFENDENDSEHFIKSHVSFENNIENKEPDSFTTENVQDNHIIKTDTVINHFEVYNEGLKDCEMLENNDTQNLDESLTKTEEIITSLNSNFENDPLKSDITGNSFLRMEQKLTLNHIS